MCSLAMEFGELQLGILLPIIDPACRIYSTASHKLYGNWFVIGVIAHHIAALIGFLLD